MGERGRLRTWLYERRRGRLVEWGSESRTQVDSTSPMRSSGARLPVGRNDSKGGWAGRCSVDCWSSMRLLIGPAWGCVCGGLSWMIPMSPNESDPSPYRLK